MATKVVRFKISSIPAGDMPPQLRQKWLDVEMHGFLYDEPSESTGLLTGERVMPRKEIAVFQTVAIDALRKKHPDAAEEWNRLGYPEYARAQFGFGVDECTFLEEPQPVPLRVYDKMDPHGAHDDIPSEN